MSAIAKRQNAGIKKDGQRYTWLEILQDMSDGQRELLMRQGTPPQFDDLAGWEFGGGNARWMLKLVGIRKFMKGFYRGPARSAQGPEPYIQGYNINVRNNADAAEHLPKPSDENPKRFGFYRVHAVDEAARDNKYPNAVLLDYGLGGNGLFGPPLRDYVVQVYPDNPDLLLGKSGTYCAEQTIRACGNGQREYLATTTRVC